MSVKEHIESFDEVYRRLGELNLANVRFPLEDIESFRWNRGPWNDSYYNYHYRRFTCHLLSPLELRDGQSVLVVGCGFGLDEKNIRRLFPAADLWSIDISSEMVKLARRSQSPSRFALALAEHLPYPDRCFDRVLSREVIEHVMNPQAMLKEIHRVLKPGGVAVVTTENEESYGPTNFYDSEIWPRLAGAAGVQVPELPYKDDAPTLGEMKAMVAEVGLEFVGYHYDGALYKYLIELAPLLRGRMRAAAHYLSCLENGATAAPLFCDQVKYVLRKPDDAAAAHAGAVGFRCIACRSPLADAGSRLKCTACAADYASADGIPDFRPASSDAGAAPAPAVVSPSFARRVLQAGIGLLSRILRRLYSTTYVLAALVASVFVRKNSERRPSGHLRADDPYQKYLGHWDR